MDETPIIFEDWARALGTEIPKLRLRRWISPFQASPSRSGTRQIKEHRFMCACDGKPINELDHGDVRKWLSDWAVKERVAIATQSQALNAVVFFFREVLKRDLGDFSDFTRARRGRKAPSVLTQAECKRLFEAMEGTSRLMAELWWAHPRVA